MNLVELKNVSLDLNGHSVLENISLVFEKGHITTVIGPNGGGKSSLVKVILGIFKPTAGRILMKKNLKIGYMPQRIEIAPFMPLSVKRFLKEPDMLEKVGCPEVLNSDMASLSGGQMQRVLLAQALTNTPELLILDEPTQGLDIMGEELLYRLILDYQKDTGCGIILISHDLNFVLKQTDKVVCLNRHICCEGKPEKISSELEGLFGKAFYPHHHNHTHNLKGEVCELSGKSV